jgi:sialate O-acetylesterase
LEKEMPEVFADHQKALEKYALDLAKYQSDETQRPTAWEKAVEEAKAANKPLPPKPQPPQDPATRKNRPAALFNGMVAPLIPYGIRGTIWYQGESNNRQAKAYQTLFPLMITGWRARWGEGDFPFLFVQIAPFKDMTPDIREAQLLTWKKTPNTAMVVTTDVGDAENIHPNRKEPVGARLALAALKLAYGEDLAYSGPIFEKAEFAGGAATLHFAHTVDGLRTKGDERLSLDPNKLVGFEIAGEDKKFQTAEASIKGNTVVVQSPAVPNPVAVRYAWANVPVANLANSAGLPASPFRTDTWDDVLPAPYRQSVTPATK